MGSPEKGTTKNFDAQTNKTEEQIREARKRLHQSGGDFEYKRAKFREELPEAGKKPVIGSWFLCKPDEINSTLEQIGWEELPNINDIKIPEEFRNTNKVYVLDTGTDGLDPRQVVVWFPGEDFWVYQVTITPIDTSEIITTTASGPVREFGDVVSPPLRGEPKTI